MRPGARWLLAALASAVLPVAVLATDGCRARGPAKPQTLTIAVRTDVSGIFPNPPMTNDSFSLDVSSNVFEGLTRLDAQLVPEPALAASWQSPDVLTWVFRLRKDARFSDGARVTSRDVVASLDAARQKPWCNAGAVSPIETVEAVDVETVRIRTRVPFPNLLARLHYGFVLPAEAITRSPVPSIGTGPFQVERWEKGRELVLTRNPHYPGPRWGVRGDRETPANPGERAGMDRVRLEVVPDDGSRARRVVQGDAQIADRPPLSMISDLERETGVRTIVGRGFRVLFLAMKVSEPPFSDVRVREAVSLSLDREELIRRALFGRAFPATQLVTPDVVGYAPQIRPPRRDLEKARRLLAEAGHAEGLSVRLDGPERRYTEDVAIVREVARQLGEAGIRVDVNVRPGEEWSRLVESGRSSFYLYGWACETRDAGDALDALIHSPTPEGLGLNNFQGISDPELDRLIEAVHTAPGPTLARDLYARALARVAELHLVVPLEIQPETMAVSRGLLWDPPLNFGLRRLETARPVPEP